MDLINAIQIAGEAHEGQLDKGGEAYFSHLVRVLEKMSTDTGRIVAVLHDVVEDTKVTLENLKERGFSSEILLAINAITRKNDESYSHYIRRVSDNDLARMVKIADLEDNMNLTRLKVITDTDLKRVKKYHETWTKLRRDEATANEKH